MFDLNISNLKLYIYMVCFIGKFITVGWGKKETQFHGSEGKQAAQKKIQVVDDSLKLQTCFKDEIWLNKC